VEDVSVGEVRGEVEREIMLVICVYFTLPERSQAMDNCQ
jgi:hypothetical protein